MESVKLYDLYQRLLAAYGPQGWWPADGPLEMIVGAILTQATAWGNAEAAIANLEGAGLLSLEGLRDAPIDRVASLIRPAVYYNQKARRLKGFCDLVAERYGGDLARLLAAPLPDLREELLSIGGIGPETADSIILYAAKKPSFVVDAYTKRLLARLLLIGPEVGYDEIRELFLSSLPPDVELYGEYHALIVRHCKEHCRARPRCEGCPLGAICPRSAAPDRDRL